MKKPADETLLGENMISISDDEYACLEEVRLQGLSRLRPEIFEKDLMITKVLRLLKIFDWGEFAIVFCGGTCLSKGYNLIERMSEDVDFKIIVPPYSETGNELLTKLKILRYNLSEHLRQAKFSLERQTRDKGRYFHFSLKYTSRFPMPLEDLSLRDAIKLEFIACTPLLDLEEVQIRSMLGEVLNRQEAPVRYQALALQETLVEKVIAFLRRTASWTEGNWPKVDHIDPDQERLVRHLYDVKQLLQNRPNIVREGNLQQLFEHVIANDQARYNDPAFKRNPTLRLANALEQLRTYSSHFEPLYNKFVNDLVWGQAVDFNKAHEAFNQLVSCLLHDCQEESGEQRSP